MNQGYDAAAIEEVRQSAQKQGNHFAWNEEEDNADDFGHFFFVGKHNDQEVIFDSFLYTLDMEYAARSLDVATDLLKERFPDLNLDEVDDEEDTEHMEQLELIMMEVEEEGLVRVKEFVELNEEAGYGISLNACLYVSEITPEVIDDFVEKFNAGTLKLNETEYSFELDDEGEDDF